MFYGNPEIMFHKLRHICASMLINRGWDVKRVQYWLGYTDVQTTMNIYADVTNELRQSEFKGLDSFFKTGRRNVEDDN